MKRIIYIFAVALSAAFVACDKDSSDTYEATVPTEFTIQTSVMAGSRASTAFDTNKEFYLFIDQDGEDYDYYVNMKYEGEKWEAYDFEDSPAKVTLTIAASNYSGVKVTALYCESDSKLTKEYLSSAESSYKVAVDEDILYATNTTNAMGTVAITDEGVISIDFARFLSQFNISIEDVTDVTNVELSGLADEFTWCAIDNSDYVVSEDSVTLTADGNEGLYSFNVAPQYSASLTINLTMVDTSVLTYIINNAQFQAGESRKVSIKNGVSSSDSSVQLVTFSSLDGGVWLTSNDEIEFETE